MNRRGFLLAIAAIPLAGIRVVLPAKALPAWDNALQATPITFNRMQQQMNWLFEQHLLSVKKTIFGDLTYINHPLLTAEDLNGQTEHQQTDQPSETGEAPERSVRVSLRRTTDHEAADKR